MGTQEADMKFEVRPAPVENIASGSVWVTLPSELPPRSVVKITNCDPGPDAGRHVYCEALAIGSYFVERYNLRMAEPQRLKELRYSDESKRALDYQGKGLIFISDYYRRHLGKAFEDFADHELTITRADGWVNHTRACLQHPQISIRLATQLGLLGLMLGILGTVLGAIGVWLGALALFK